MEMPAEEDADGDAEPRPELRAGLVLPVRAGRDGGPSRWQVRGPEWRRTSHGFYVPSWVDGTDVAQRIAEASVLVPARHAITGWAALAIRGARWFDGRLADGSPAPVTIVIGTHDIRRQPGVELSGEGFNPALVEWVGGIPVTDARYAVSYLMRYARSDAHAAVELAKAAYDDLVSIEEMQEFLGHQNGWTGVPRARRAVGLADENCWSPPEFWMLDIWCRRAGFRRPLCNRPIFDLAGRHVATPDLLDPVAGVMGEYDGPHHLRLEQSLYDLGRAEDLRRLGLIGVTMVAGDISYPDAVMARIEAAYRTARQRPDGPRAWTIEQPPGWVDVSTVERRRALDPEQRRRFLRYRQAA